MPSTNCVFFNIFLVISCWTVFSVLIVHYGILMLDISNSFKENSRPDKNNLKLRAVRRQDNGYSMVGGKIDLPTTDQIDPKTTDRSSMANIYETDLQQHKQTASSSFRLDQNLSAINVARQQIGFLTHNKVHPVREKVILFWNGYQNFCKEKFGHPFRSCPINACSMSTDRRQSKSADAIIFNIAAQAFKNECQGVEPKCEIPNVKPSHQVWAFLAMEPPCHTNIYRHSNKEMLLNSFNWTFTYRKDSDIWSPYGMVIRRDKPLKRNYSASVKLKTKLVAWVVSDCITWSRREEYVAELMKYIDVDILGDCGRPCISCWSYVNATYKFYLAFENSFAVDYLTEKFFRAWHLDVVLVTRSGVDYSRFGIRPEMHIDTSNFSSPKELAKYLLLLDKNDSLYLPYLEWKNTHVSTRPLESRYMNWCGLCEKVHEEPKTSKVYTKRELLEWQYGNGDIRGCYHAKDIVGPGKNCTKINKNTCV
ncbi:alpha-(1,3)-fucosyltransferase 6 [Lingula anatina]|uniref:Fucosyltransferase n=1 Tax=Lingula anatina TaxID=7574 RepID=A0A1S3HX23_LINAN|nr:alpha-(1,3)-fucosyltransferase 6 [Lingula anatina]|eukprot:XP_013389614.1 alpha-(1,3)-fucosyltransferase 6 [Lingula anatina]